MHSGTMENQLSIFDKDRYLWTTICTKSCVQYLCFPCATAEMFRKYSSFPVKIVFERMKRVWLSNIRYLSRSTL